MAFYELNDTNEFWKFEVANSSLFIARCNITEIQHKLKIPSQNSYITVRDVWHVCIP